jgi:guanyl-specific ribonuclease Sa
MNTKGPQLPNPAVVHLAKPFKPAVAQPKIASGDPQVRRPAAPPVYRPQPTPKVLQRKQAGAIGPPAIVIPKPFPRAFPSVVTSATIQRRGGVVQLGKGKNRGRKIIKHTVPKEAKDVARDIVTTEGAAYGTFGNNEGLLPAAGRYDDYYEGAVDIGIAAGTGQRRVVVLIKKNKGGTMTGNVKYYSPTHYGTGSDAGVTKADFYQFV